MKKPKPKVPESFQAQMPDEDAEACESMLAPVVRKCLNTYGRSATGMALEWMLNCVDKKKEDEGIRGFCARRTGEIFRESENNVINQILERNKKYEDEDESN